MSPQQHHTRMLTKPTSDDILDHIGSMLIRLNRGKPDAPDVWREATRYVERCWNEDADPHQWSILEGYVEIWGVLRSKATRKGDETMTTTENPADRAFAAYEADVENAANTADKTHEAEQHASKSERPSVLYAIAYNKAGFLLTDGRSERGRSHERDDQRAFLLYATEGDARAAADHINPDLVSIVPFQIHEDWIDPDLPPIVPSQVNEDDDPNEYLGD